MAVSTLPEVSVDANAALAADVDAAVAAATGLRLVGWEASDTNNAACVANIVHGATGAGGTLLVPISLPANGQAGRWYGLPGIPCASGLSIDYVSGAPTIALFYATIT